jgi:hypothetical protein
MEKKIMTRKCETCGADMVELFSSSVCSKDCKGDTPLETPEEGDFIHAANIKGNPKYPDRCVQGDELWTPSEGAIKGDKHRDPYSLRKQNRSGSYPAPTEEEIQQQKKKMLKALANFNTIQTVKWDYIDSIKEFGEAMIKAMGIPSHIIDGVKNNDEKVRGQRITQMVMDEACNLDASIFDNIISSLKEGNMSVEDEKIKMQIEKLSPEDGDLLVFRMPPTASDEAYSHMTKMLEELELDAKSMVIPDSITVEHFPLNKDKDNDPSEE